MYEMLCSSHRQRGTLRIVCTDSDLILGTRVRGMKPLVNLIPEDVRCSLCIANQIQASALAWQTPHGDLQLDLLLHARNCSHVSAAFSLELYIPEGLPPRR